MRIAFLSPPPNLSGGERVVSTYAKLLAARGHQVSVICSQPDRPTWTRCFKNLLRGRRWPRRNVIGDSHYENDGIDYRVVDHTGPILQSDVPASDVVIATFFTTAEWLANIQAGGATKVYFIQGDDARSMGDGALGTRARATLDLPYYRIVVSNWLLRLPKSPAVPDVVVVPNSVDLRLFDAPRRGKQERPTLGFMYCTTHFRGYDVTLQAITLLKRQFPNLQIRSFGAKAPSQDFQLPDGCAFLHRPPQQQLAATYASCDCWLFSSRYEGFGLPILEAMASRTPVAATAAGAAPEIIAKGGGLMAPIDDAEALAMAAAEILQMSDAKWQELSDQAYDIASSYTWEDATDLFESALTAAVRGEWEQYAEQTPPPQPAAR